MLKVLKTLVLFSIAIDAIGTNYVTIGSGNWTDPLVWQSGNNPPVTITSNDIIFISTGHVITLNSALTIDNTCQLNVNGSLLINGNLINNNQLTVNIHGKLVIDGTFSTFNNYQTAINGDLLVTNNFDLNNSSTLAFDGSLTAYGNLAGANNNAVTGQGEVNTKGSISGINTSGYNGTMTQYISTNIGLSNNGSVLRVGTNAVIYIDGGTLGNFNSIFYNGNDGRIDSDGKIILEGDWNNFSSDSVFKNVDSDGTVKFSGTSPQNIGGSKATLFESLITNNANGLIINDNVLLNESLGFEMGDIATGAYDTVIVLNNASGAITSQGLGKNVIGNLRRYMNAGTYSFPIASDDDYLPALLEINSLGSMQYLSVKFTSSALETVPTGLNVDGTPIVEFLDRGYWTFTPDNGTGVHYDITLTSSGHTNGGAEASQHAVFKRDGGNWQSVGDHDNLTQSGNETNPITAKRSNMTGFSDFIIGKSDYWPLPVELTSFYSICGEDGITLNWETLSEINNEAFTLEYSLDGTGFSVLCRVPGAGSSRQVNQYTFFHPIITNQTIYYRLSQHDFDGRIMVFPLLASQCLVNPFEGLQVYKTDGSTVNYSFYSQTGEPFKLTVNDPLGRILYFEVLETIIGFNENSLTLPKVIKGVYIFRVVSTKHHLSKKIILE